MHLFKKAWFWLLVALAGVLCLLPRGLAWLKLRRLTMGEAASIGIIGGADGPTAIFVTTQVSKTAWIGTAVSLLLVLGGLVGWLCCRKK